jgi:hypothetical protein
VVSFGLWRGTFERWGFRILVFDNFYLFEWLLLWNFYAAAAGISQSVVSWTCGPILVLTLAFAVLRLACIDNFGQRISAS